MSTKRKSIDTSEKRVDSIDVALRARLVRALGEKLATELLDWIRELEAKIAELEAGRRTP